MHYDIYSLLLPNNRRSLEEFSKFDNQRNIKDVKQKNTKISSNYEKVSLLGYSYGGGSMIYLKAKLNVRKNLDKLI